MNEHTKPRVTRTTCPYCGVGCGVLARPDGQGGATISGDPDHPANFGRLCSKGTALGETLGLSTRVLHPMLRDADGRLRRASWDDALDRVAAGLSEIGNRHGPDAVAFYLSGQLLTEDYYVANKLMKGFIGSANVDTNSRLCMASSVAGHRRAFGADIVPGNYEDLDIADLIVLVGSNAAWCHPVLYRRMMANKQVRGAKIVVIDPRRTATAEDSDLFLAIAPGMDSVLFSGLLVHLADRGALDFNFIERHTAGLPQALAAARDLAPDAATTAQRCCLEAEEVARFFDLFTQHDKVVTCYSQGVNQSAQGTDKVTTIINCHLASGRIGRPGMGPFSLTGQPNAMGGREVGGLANQLAAHMGFTPPDVDRVRRFWDAPRMATREGHKAVGMFDAIARGEIKALWVMATNPAVSLPRAGAMAAALQKLDLLIVSENVLSTDTVDAGAHIVLPAAAWGEKDGTVTNSERRISRQRAFLTLPGEARPDWWIVSQVARRMGFAGFEYRSAADIFREHAALSAFENDGTRGFDIGAFADHSNAQFNALQPTQWPARTTQTPVARLFARGQFYTPDGKARFNVPARPALKDATCDQFPLRLNTGRMRDQWHTMSRSGLSPSLAAHAPEPCVYVAPADASAYGLEDGGFARVSTAHGNCVLAVKTDAGQRPGSVFVPIHWSHTTASSARTGDLVAAHADPYSGQPEAKATAASVAPVAYAARGFALSSDEITPPAGTWWCKVAVSGGHGLLLAGDLSVDGWRDAARAMFGASARVEYVDAPGGVYRAAQFAADRLQSCLFIAPASKVPRWDAMKALLAHGTVSNVQRRTALSGHSADGLVDPGALVCACFGVGVNTIREAITAKGLLSVEAIGTALRAGTNCGSCIPELKKILSHDTLAHAV
ncbi:MAG: molybdopterin-dependent oxidoreductase [Pseudolabrys sp.]|nr:molybdopterin-dependent oxidoreductase [Pseudolabrys sp.]